MIKIYFNEKILFLTTQIDSSLNLYYGQDGTVFLDNPDADSVKEFLATMQNPDVLGGILMHPDLNHLLDIVKQQFTVVEAAGGLIYHKTKGYLFIYRRGKWDLPKGKLDEGEDRRTCAVREAGEETGVKGLEVKEELLVTYHTYVENNKDILKETYWYLMETSDNGDLQPETSEDIEVCEWVPSSQLQHYLKNTHPSVIDVMDKGMSIVPI